ncbi:hypothetical protein LXA43DRAFT_92376 [Ganoderma leucocontextum]|nr:hypothetical protein LXA43DRAFT_92376 [Ganoderma leucocontextum]
MLPCRLTRSTYRPSLLPPFLLGVLSYLVAHLLSSFLHSSFAHGNQLCERTSASSCAASLRLTPFPQQLELLWRYIPRNPTNPMLSSRCSLSLHVPVLTAPFRLRKDLQINLRCGNTPLVLRI